MEPVAAIQIAAVEAPVGFELVAVNGFHRSDSFPHDATDQ